MLSGTFILSSKGYPSTPENLENGISFSNHEEVGYFDQKNWKTFTWLRSGLPCVKSVPIRLWERLSLG